MQMNNHNHSLNCKVHDFGWAFAIGIFLNTAFIIVEVIFGFQANSLALLADAGHNLSDVMSLLVAWGAIRLSHWKPTVKHTYGFRKSSILAALFNALLLLVGIGAILLEAIRRLQNPVMPQYHTMIWVAAVGIAINAVTAMMFLNGRKEDINIRGAFLHMLADAVISAGVVLTGIMISLTGVKLIDPLISIGIAVIIFFGSWALLRESMNLALDAVPENVDQNAINEYLLGLPAVQDVHHLHIWGLSTTESALTAHIVLSKPDNDNLLLMRIQKDLHKRYHIEHATIQFEAQGQGSCLTRLCSLYLRNR